MTRSADPTGRRYETIAQIGRGGMAEVLLTIVHAGAGVRRLAVLKRIWPELATDPDFVTMFLDEARLSLRLNHANVVQTYEIRAGEGELAMAMEYLDGQPLTRVLNRLLRGPGELGLPLRLRILTSVLAGLEHAHTLADLDGTPLGVVHRDVSPQNVFVTYDGQVKLVDFGVAKTLAASHHTRPGTLKGKLAYMAPEQLQRNVIDRRADLFAVGIMLWEMLACRRMWHGMTEVEIVAHLAASRPLPTLPSDGSLPPGLDAICARALDPDPDRRYQTAAEMEMDLEGVLIGAADSHARNLGKVVSMAFRAERAERQAIIERCLRRSGTAPIADDPVPIAASGTASVEITLSGLDDEPATAVARVAKATAPVGLFPTRALWFRRAVTLSGLVAVVLTILFVDGWRRPSLSDARAAQGHRTAFAWPATDPPPAPPFALAPAAPVASAQPPRATLTATASEDPPRSRRRHHAVPIDGDGTLPPSEDDAEPTPRP